ncbi:MAG: FAD/NAD(P)-binding oxidoreductase [Chloroflexi bacterium]|nr:FAD/NAD(P)-binding oxidoreductase [Chloroflexota bacterium]
MARKRIIVLGGGIGGMVVANQLRKRLSGEHQVIVVERNPRHYFAPSYVWLAMGWRKQETISRELSRLLSRGVQLIQGEISRIDIGEKRIFVGEDEVRYDYMVMALGAELTPPSIPGLPEAAYSFYEVSEAQRLRDALASFDGGRVALVVAGLPYKCPAAPYEGVLLADYLFRKKGIRDNVQMEMFVPEPAPMPVAGPAAGQMIHELLQGREIGYHPRHRLKTVDPAKKQVTFEDDATAEYDMLITIPPHRCPEVVASSGLTNESGWVPVDQRTLQTSAEGVYALGDMTTITLASGMPLPKAGVFAHGEAHVVARNIAADIAGIPGSARHTFNGDGACFLETGFGKAAYATGNFYAEPNADIKLRKPSFRWHWGKILFEKRWLRGWF